MFENFGLEISRIFKNAEIIRYDLRHPYVGSEHLLLAMLKENDDVSNLLKKYKVTYSSFKKELVRVVGSASHASELNLYTPLLKRIIENALEDAKEDNGGIVTTTHLFLSMLEENEGIALSREKILNNVWNYDYYGEDRTIDTHVKKIRSKLGEKGKYIKTIWGIGYKFETVD